MGQGQKQVKVCVLGLWVWSSGCFVFPGMEGQPCTERGLCGVGLACDPSSQVCRDERFLCAGLQCGEVAGVNCGTCSDTDRCELNHCFKSGMSMGMVLVSGGEFFMGCNDAVDAQCEDDEPSGRMVNVPVFQIDQFEVTVEAYATCVRAGECSLPTTGGSCNWNVEDRLSHPINCVDWHQARVYCEWLGKQLPTHVQWEKAARGTDGRVYPWGNSFDTTRANVDGTEDGFSETAPVDSFRAGASPYDALNMAGNVWEWTSYCDQSVCELRGGSWYNEPRHARASYRFRLFVGYRNIVVGFRCASP